MSEKIVQIDRAERDIWNLVKDILKIVEGEKGTLRVKTIDCKDSYVVLQITKLPKEQYATTKSLGKETAQQRPYTTTSNAKK
jgi:hypothetical protein